ncbi:hypothetical protein SAMN05444413_106101 [Roseivivax marinus]|uniref:hypothetical protein n=1 Tax=Roseivivax marinus TaxID=1379903 RepID=UPI0008B41CEA|nr:hypothetical protein [Roseivivax marinus]SEL14927.1 hypothetical protein SAMN05444413_106101 [Roseivivax marinus]
MTPDFALNLSFEGIALLQRGPNGWTQIGEAQLDGDLDADMTRLRAAAEALSPDGTVVKLVIPAEQIKFLDRPDPGEDNTRATEAHAAVDGATPYAMNELVYDFTIKKDRLFIAVVARETLEEAEAFALAHGFRPACAVALPKPRKFKGEPFFGALPSWNGPQPERDARPIRLVSADEAGAAAASAATASPQGSGAAPAQDAPAPEPSTPPKAEPALEPAAAPVPAETAPSSPETPRPTAEVEAKQAATKPVASEAQEPATRDSGTTEAAASLPLFSVERTTATESATPAVTKSETAPRTPEVKPATSEPASAAAKEPQKAAPAVAAPSGTAREAKTGSAEPSAETPSTPNRQPAPAAVGATSASATSTAAAAQRPEARETTPDSAPTGSKPESGTAASTAPGDPKPHPGQKVPAEAAATDTGSDSEALSSAPAETSPTDAGTTATSSETKAAPASAGTGPAAPAPPVAPATPTFSSVRAAREAEAPAGAPRVGPAQEGGTLNRPIPARPNPDEVQARLRSLAASRPDDRAPESPATPPKPAAATGAPAPDLAASLDRPAASEAPTTDTQGSEPNRIASLRPGRKKAAKAKAPRDEAQSMTVFGARSDAQNVGGKPRFLGLMLTAALLIFLAGVAAWASVFLDDGIARLFRTAESSAVATATGPAVEEPVAENADATADTQVAALDTETDASEGPAAFSEPTITPEQLDANAAEANYAATGIWARAPEAPLPLEPGPQGTEDVYLLSLDNTVSGSDAIALPALDTARADATLPAPMSPAPADTVFDLDARGLVNATPEGAINPDQIRIFAGLPPAVPPNRTEALPDGAAAVPTTIEEVETLRRLGSTRPNDRPVTLIEDTERAAFNGVSRTELASLRPLVRPESAQVAAEEAAAAEEGTDENGIAEATAQAIAASRKPITRPRNFASIVEDTRAAQAEAAPQQVAAAAQVAPQTVSPSAPSNRSVSQQATVRNALNLRGVNLIGVYGQPSSRRALVRLSNGRYQKVKVGDRIDGGRVAAIGESELRYVKSGRNVTLEMP